MDVSDDHQELVVLKAIVSQIRFFLLLSYWVYRRRSRRRFITQHAARARYSMIERIPDQVKCLNSLINMTDETCINQLRMCRNAFFHLCYILEVKGGLTHTKHVKITEQVAMFLVVLSHHTKNRIVKQHFVRSGYTVSVIFHRVLNALLRIHTCFLSTPEPIDEICSSDRWKWFKGCLGALDGTYIPIQVPQMDKGRYRNRKGQISVNVLAICDTNMKYVYMLTGWEGSAADSRVLKDDVARPNGLKVPNGNYYLCDCGYTNGEGFLAPYKGVRYHIQEWNACRVPLANEKEFFNKTHAKARNVIERSFALLKDRWAILRSNSFYPVKVANRIIMACCLLQNYIPTEHVVDPIEAEVLEAHEPNDDPEPEYIDQVSMNNSSRKNNPGTWAGPAKTTRRTWTMQEEVELASALKDLVVRGYTCDNGFTTGYQGLLEQAKIAAFPSTDLRVESHINSRIHVWRKNYSSISSVLKRSGFGWNSTSKTITVSNDDVWDNYVKNHLMMWQMSWTTMRKEKKKTTLNEATGDHTPPLKNIDWDKAQSMFVSCGDASASAKNNSFKGKRKLVDDGDAEYMRSRKAVFEVLAKIGDLDIEQRISISKSLVNNTKDLDLFFSLPTVGKSAMVKMMLVGTY
ncbi:hypothetical protein BUALT_Bualt19G0128500 [Buddleja alternifolia]|uniref:Transposase n=1 Tax=Buddleja alternifolia TaxID=168488 RepID=A0AAV6WBZ4_9LAMI|nr:hypothetical protein BUALT_Bualt19G0128500 [Buddleja alternifolia]